jgi:hypothetical protein
MRQIHHESLDPRAVLHRSGNAGGEGGTGLRAVGLACADMGAMFGDLQGLGGGRSNTGRAAKPLLAASSKTPPQPAHVCGKWSMVESAFSTWRGVLPGCPGCPPDFLPEGVRRLLIRRGFLSPSLDGGLPLLLLFRPRRRSSSAMRVCSVTMRSCCWVLRAIGTAIMSDAAAAVPGDKAAAGWGSESEAEDMESLTHVQNPESTGRARSPTWAVAI